MNEIWHSAEQAPRMTFAGEPVSHFKLVLIRVFHDGHALFEQWDYTPSIDGPWDVFAKDHRVKVWAKAGRLLSYARKEAGV